MDSAQLKKLAEEYRDEGEHEMNIRECTCIAEGGYGEDGTGIHRTPVAGCPVHADIDDFDELESKDDLDEDTDDNHG